ncbi:MAG: hypothetical protein SFU98_22320 [Leptospiraceae bacterium]|nr:hypothetical protein [Leptospiraceae bacterium]
MQEYFVPIVIILFLILGFVLFSMSKKAEKKLPLEEGKSELFSEKYGGVVGLIKYSGPYIRVTLYDEFMVIKCNDDIVLKYSEITDFKESAFLFTPSVVIEHNNKSASGKIELFLKDIPKFLSILKTKKSI